MRNYIGDFKRGYVDSREGSNELAALGPDGVRTALRLDDTPEYRNAADSIQANLGKITRMGYETPLLEKAGKLAYEMLHRDNAAKARAVSDTYEECLSLIESGEIPRAGLTVKKSLKRLRRKFQ